jgi:hypothetical protein
LEAAEFFGCNNDDFIPPMHGNVLRPLAAHFTHEFTERALASCSNQWPGGSFDVCGFTGFDLDVSKILVMLTRFAQQR